MTPRLARLPIGFLALLSAGFLSTATAAPVTTDAEFAYIADYETGEVLFEKNADTPTAPASMSKLMTVAIVLEKLKAGELDLNDQFFVSEKAWRMQGSKMWVRVDTKIALKNLLRGIVVQSGNDACIVIAENISGTEEAFAQLMTRKAREWGLKNSTFSNASGWPDPGQKMSMRDLGLLTRKIISEYPEYYSLFAEKEFTWEKIRQQNRNPLLDNFDGADGLKTGHTDESGFGLVGSAVKDGQRRIIVVNGLDSQKQRNLESSRLLNIAFNDFERKEVYSAGDIAGDALVFKGKAENVPLITREPVSMIVHRTQLDKVKATVVYEGPVAAPVAAGQQIGFLKVSKPDGSSREYPLFAGRNVAETGFLGKVGMAAKKILAKPDRSKAKEQLESEQPASE